MLRSTLNDPSLELREAPDLARLGRPELERMAAAGQEVVEVFRVLAKTSDNVVGELIRDRGTFFEWDHYPPGDVYDRDSHAQYYYHAHPVEQRFVNEHGHFHTFLRPKGMPPGIKPAALPGVSPPEDPNDALSHLIGISMTPSGVPFRLFTVNRWVTGETWYRAADVRALIDYFKIDHAQPSWPVNRWTTAMVRLFHPQIVALVEMRDRTIAAWQREDPENDVFEDRSREVTSYVDISVDDQLRAVERVL